MRKKKCLYNLIVCLISLTACVVVNFFLPRLMPGDPVKNLIGMDGDYISKEVYERYYLALGLDKPLIVQFFNYLKGLLVGDLGYSYHLNKSVTKLISESFLVTLQIALPAVIISAIIAVVLGLLSGYNKNSVVDKVVSGGAILVNAIPSFLIAIILIIVFSYKLNWFPYGSLSLDDKIGIAGFFDRLKHLFLPVLTLVIASTPPKLILLRNSVASAMDEKYILFSLAKGLGARTIKYKHIFINVCQPFISMVFVNLGKIFAGAVVVETVFSIRGMGYLMSNAIQVTDFPVLQGCLFVTAIIVILANLIGDIICYLIDPKQRLEGVM